VPKFVKEYADLRLQVSDAVRRYVADVRSGEFPGSEQTFEK